MKRFYLSNIGIFMICLVGMLFFIVFSPQVMATACSSGGTTCGNIPFACCYKDCTPYPAGTLSPFYAGSTGDEDYSCNGQAITNFTCDGVNGLPAYLNTGIVCSGTCTNYCIGKVGCGFAPSGTAASNCGSGQVCNGYGACVSFCGDSIVSSGEQCDLGSNNGVNTCTAVPYGSSCTYCGSSCQAVTVSGGSCGDGIVNAGEQCDYGIADSQSFSRPVLVDDTGASWPICNNDLTRQDFCQLKGYTQSVKGTAYSGGGCINATTLSTTCSQTGSTCIKIPGSSIYWVPSGDAEYNVTCSNSQGHANGVVCSTPGCSYCTSSCSLVTIPSIPDWTTSDFGWSLSSIGALHAATASSKIFLTTDYGINLKSDKSYTISYTLSNPNNCILSFDLNDGNCINPSTFLQGNCFSNQVLAAVSTGSNTFNIPSNTNSPNGYFRGAHLRIIADSGCAGVDISNIVLSESSYTSDSITYDYSKMSSSITSISSCCPTTYCWDGNECVNSDSWMTNATYPAMWNNIFDTNWTDEHVNSSTQLRARGYRCVINSSNIADWVASDIKYDWDFKASGYCADAMDCFVEKGYNLGGSDGCIHNNQVVSDKISGTYTVGSGNHYCYMGNWTTRSYMIAQLLQNLSTNSEYTMHCYDNDMMALNTPTILGSDSGILSACVLVKSIGNYEDQIITGIIIDNDLNAGAFLSSIVDEYESIYGSLEGAVYYDGFEDCTLDTATPIASTNFTRCFEKSSSDGAVNNGLYIYFNRDHRYFIISNDRIDGLSKQTFWTSISGFFRGLFRPDIDLIPYSAINYTSSYDRIYIAKSAAGPEVRAIEEYKYDERTQSMVTLLNIRHNRTTDLNNPINMTQILVAVNKTSPDAKYGAYDNGQEIIIRTENRTGLWRYFASSSRPRVE
jgi:hypothetical protein